MHTEPTDAAVPAGRSIDRSDLITAGVYAGLAGGAGAVFAGMAIGDRLVGKPARFNWFQIAAGAALFYWGYRQAEAIDFEQANRDMLENIVFVDGIPLLATAEGLQEIPVAAGV